jgi:hypothetical protein
MFKRNLLASAVTLVIAMSFTMVSTSCGRRVVAPQPVNVNVGTAAPQQHVPTSRKEIRILKKARKAGVY